MIPAWIVFAARLMIAVGICHEVIAITRGALKRWGVD